MKNLGSDLAEFGKKRNADHDFPPHYIWAENKNMDISRSLSYETELLNQL